MGYIVQGPKPEIVSVSFTQDRYWLFMEISGTGQSVKIRMSDVYDPIPSLINWMEAILTDVEMCAFSIDEEGTEKGIRAVNRWNDTVYITIDDNYGGHAYLKVLANRRQLIDALYNGLKNFAHSGDYHPQDWECETLEDRLVNISGKDTEEILDDLALLNSADLMDIFFSAAPNYWLTWPALGDDETAQYKKSIAFALDRENKDHQLGMKKTPIEWTIDQDFDSWTQPWRKKYLRDYICSNVGDHDGSKLKDIYSISIEKYLNKDQ
ncbi:MAG: hypothetical protein JBO36_14495 [Candidatus Thiodiazotropha taylori]|nr:hypothetical protein [Candidatus Thiodiazotropha taylori]